MINKILQRLFVFVCLLAFSSVAIAQDIIYTKDGRELKVNIIESNGENVKYKPYEDNSSPVRTMDVQYIDFIKYEDGTIERYVKSESNVVEDETQKAETEDVSLDFLNVQYEKQLARYNSAYRFDKSATYFFLVNNCNLDGY